MSGCPFISPGFCCEPPRGVFDLYGHFRFQQYIGSQLESLYLPGRAKGLVRMPHIAPDHKGKIADPVWIPNNAGVFNSQFQDDWYCPPVNPPANLNTWESLATLCHPGSNEKVWSLELRDGQRWIVYYDAIARSEIAAFQPNNLNQLGNTSMDWNISNLVGCSADSVALIGGVQPAYHVVTENGISSYAPFTSGSLIGGQFDPVINSKVLSIVASHEYPMACGINRQQYQSGGVSFVDWQFVVGNMSIIPSGTGYRLEIVDGTVVHAGTIQGFLGEGGVRFSWDSFDARGNDYIGVITWSDKPGGVLENRTAVITNGHIHFPVTNAGTNAFPFGGGVHVGPDGYCCATVGQATPGTCQQVFFRNGVESWRSLVFETDNGSPYYNTSSNSWFYMRSITGTMKGSQIYPNETRNCTGTNQATGWLVKPDGSQAVPFGYILYNQPTKVDPYGVIDSAVSQYRYYDCVKQHGILPKDLPTNADEFENAVKAVDPDLQ